MALIEVSLFGFLGDLVDWLSKADPNTFWSDHAPFLIAMSVVVLVLLPILKFFYEAVVHQGLLGNFTMRTRWQAHRYVLRQSMEFFHNDYAGRVAAKVMQTSMAVREVVMKIAEVLLYVVIYFTGAVVLFASSDLRLSAPLVLWLCGYLVAMYYFVPRLGAVSHEQSDARSIMTGRIVDTYTNISTVKMFAHADREDDYAQDSMAQFLDTVHRQMRLVTLLTVALNVLNALLLFAVAATSIWLWSISAVTTGAIAFSVGLVMRLQGMSHWIMWEVAGLFENVGVVQDGLETIARERTVVDKPDAKPLAVTKGEIRFDQISFNYGRDPETGRGSVIQDLSLRVAPGREGRAGRPLGRRQVDARQSAAALLRPRRRPHPDRRPGHRRGHAGQPARPDRHGDPGHLAAAPHGPGQHPLWPARCGRAGGDGGCQEGGAPTSSSASSSTTRAAPATTRTWASAASSCRAASASASPSPACC